MSAPPFMQLYVADYLGDTRHLTTEQHGAYMLLLMAMWRAGGSLPDDDAKLARMVGLTPARWARISDDVLAFFQTDGTRLSHKRVTAELEKSQRTSEARSQAGARGAEAKSLKTQEPTSAIAVDLPEQTESPASAYQTSDIREITDADASVVPRRRRADVAVWDDAFTAAWEAYPKSGRERSMSRAKLWPMWREACQQAGGPEKLLEAVRRYAAEDKTHKGDCGAPAFDRWLKWGRWEHFLGGPATTATPTMVFPDPDVRGLVVAAKGEAWAHSWLDPCAWEPERRLIVPRTRLAAQRLRSEVLRELSSRQVQIQEMQA
jgi:uncharacterized protein YdaU (DUF1376 family)